MNEESIPFQLLFNPFLINILQKDIPENGSLDPEEALTLVGIYKSQYHPNLSAHFFRQLQHAPKQETSKHVFNAIMNWEIRRSGHPSKKQAIDCILNTSSNDFELQKWMLDMLDWGFFADLKLWVKNSALGHLASNKFLTIIDFLKSMLQIILFYWDLFKDLATFTIFNHMSTNILVSNLKLRFRFYSLFSFYFYS